MIFGCIQKMERFTLKNCYGTSMDQKPLPLYGFIVCTFVNCGLSFNLSCLFQFLGFAFFGKLFWAAEWSPITVKLEEQPCI